MKLRLAVFMGVLGLLIVGCKKDETAAPPINAQSAENIKWDKASVDKNRTPPAIADKQYLDWKMPGTIDMDVDLAKYTIKVTGKISKVTAVWQRLGVFHESHLKSWKEALAADPESASDVLDAFNEMAYAVTGPGGFWRKTLPKKWLGCPQNEELPPCIKLASLEKDLARWDKVQEKIGKLSVKSAKRFLARNYSKMLAYIDTYVPTEFSDSEMKKTGFFKQHLAESMTM
jgi:hypothetical protein